MKKLTLILSLIIVLSVGSNAQDTTFNTTVFPIQGTTSITSIVKLNNLYYMSIANIDTPNILISTYGILKLDSLFNITDTSIIHTGKYIISNRGHGFDINKLDTSFIFAGLIRYANTKENGYLVKFDKNLDTLWTLQIPHPDTTYADTSATPWVALRDVKVTPSGDYIIVGNYNYHCQGNRNRSFIIKMDSEGVIVWYRFLDMDVYQGIIKNFEIDSIDSGFYFTSKNNGKSYLNKYDTNGFLLWSNLYTTTPLTFTLTDIKATLNDIFIVCYFVIPPFTNQSIPRLSVSCINRQSHMLKWSKKFYSISVTSNWLNQETLDIEITPNGNIAIGSVGRKNTSNNFTADFRAQILMLNRNGDSLWSRYYTYNDNSMGAEDMQFNDMVVCPDGGLLFGGDRAYNAQFLDAWLVKTDSMGYCPYAYTVGIEHNELIISKNKLSVFPNPARDNINFRFSRNLNKNIKLSIYSASGTLVKQQKLNEFDFEYRVNIGELSTGIYFVSMEADGEIVGRGKFVKE